jgi:ATP-dependent RNA circularization protein (DNA/RNA ligase family)
MKPFADQKRILPEFPKTRHLPWKPNTVRGDLVVSEDEAKVIFENPRTFVQEKVDGANSGMALVNGEPIIRNREHILRKGFMKDTPAKKQFASIWGWFYDHRDNFETLNDLLGPVSVYGEWMVQIHGMVYDSLPDWFLAYDVYDYETEKFFDPEVAMNALQKAGFSVVPTLKVGVSSYEELEALANDNSPFAAIPREGVYVKVSDGKWQVDRFKMVRQGFVQGGLFDNKTLRKNRLAK